MSKRIAPRANQSRVNLTPKATSPYEAFDKIDGRHPWQSAVTEGFVSYPVRKLDHGKVFYFNFALAREMGLIPANHPDEMTSKLQQKILDTFSLQIINEYDQAQGTRFPKNVVKENKYMATRYLQLQHADKRGRTSGDGRGIWNGTYSHKGTTWDVSSRGTGVTCLAPGSVEAQRPLKTGEGQFGYGCGLADVSELLGSAVLSEILHLRGVGTERVLTIIDLGKGCGIGVRAAPNLLRPAHLFLYLKQERLEPLRRGTDYLIERQCRNGQWKFSPSSPDRYKQMLTEISKSFAHFAARLEREYIFAWLDWDGDNVLASAGIIDYGSIRQFGLRHDQYRYDDVQRFSTNLNEQRGKARLTVQVFAQLVHYVETGKRRPMEDFANHWSLRNFDREFDTHLRESFLKQVGFDEEQVSWLCKYRASVVEELYASFLVLEKTKSKQGLKKVPDGVNRPAVFNMRAALRELPRWILQNSTSWKDAFPSSEEFIDLIDSSFAKKADRKLRGPLNKHIERFRKAYVQTLKTVCGEQNQISFLKNLGERAEDANRQGRVTGNGAEFVVDELLKAKRRGMKIQDIQLAIDLFIANQSPKASLTGRKARLTSLQSDSGRLFQALLNIASEFEEDI